MRLYEISIRRFRGIKKLDWTSPNEFSCLVGPRDSTKSTILDAIEYALSPRWNVVFDDTDFFNLDTSEPIEVTVTVGEVPESLLVEEKFGLHLRGWNPATKKVNDEPEPASDNLRALSIRLTVDSALEPQWNVVNDHNEAKRISHKDRELLGLARLGSSVDWHLSWQRGSILSRFTAGNSKDVGSISGVLAEATRAARKTFTPSAVDTLNNAAQRTEILAKHLGVQPITHYQPHLDFESASVGMGGVTLHDGEIPLRNAGLGTRRLLTLALQKEIARAGGVTLVDEVEHALEPHAIRQLLTFLKKGSEIPEGGKGAEPKESARECVVLTTHSPTVIVELDATNLFMVRNEAGQTTVEGIPDELQSVVRIGPDAFLGKAVIVCEGKTEYGVCRALDNWWSGAIGGQSLKSLGLLGVVPIASVSGGGSEAPRIAQGFVTLGFRTLLFADSDEPLNPSEEDLRNAGGTVVQWQGSCSIEQRVFWDLPWDGVVELLTVAAEEKDEESVRSLVASRLGINATGLSRDIKNWNTVPEVNEQTVRDALGKAAKVGKWFKSIALGETLGNIVTKYLNVIPNTDLAKKISALRLWVDSSE